MRGTKTFRNGLTVAELKAIIADWPDHDENGVPVKVMIEVGPGEVDEEVVHVSQPNSASMLFVSRAFDDWDI